MEKISWTEHNNKLRSAGNDWTRKSLYTDTRRETKEMEQTWAVICTSILLYFTLIIILITTIHMAQ